jgi:phage terminase large subunit
VPASSEVDEGALGIGRQYSVDAAGFAKGGEGWTSIWNLTPLVSSSSKERQPSHIGYGGAAGGGKSLIARAIATGVAMQWPGSVCGLFRSTRPELWRNHISKFLLELPKGIYRYRGQTSELEWENGSRTVLGYLRGERDLARYQGDEYDCLIFEESTHYTWNVVNWLTSNRLRSSGARGSQPFAIYPSNPGGVGHVWFKRLFIDRRYRPDLLEEPRNYAFVQAFLRHNEILRRRDPAYEKKLQSQPEPYRSWYLEGDWQKGAGTALPQLDRSVHLVRRFDVPDHWAWFAGFDWGFQHPWVFGLYTVSEDGRIFKVDTIRGRRDTDSEIIQAIQETAKARGYPLDRLTYVAADRGIFDKRGRDVGYEGPTLAERMTEAGIPVIPANIERIHGLRQLREYLQWEGREAHVGELTVEEDPNLFFMDTEGNLAALDRLENIVTDPDRPEDALKVDADEFGEGGDDDYDETRYAVASRPALAKEQADEQWVRAWDRSVLRHEEQTKRRVRDRPVHEGSVEQQVLKHMGG